MDIRLELRSNPRLLAATRALVATYAQRIGFDDLQSGQISLAVDEALCNVIKHGYEGREDGRILVRFEVDQGKRALRILIEDEARQVDPDSIRSRDLDEIRPGGLGVYIIREVMDDVKYERRSEGGMRLVLCKRLPAQTGDPAPAEEHATS
jgi:anti-sigma regulatory factor (Ser/Thr protein kinase)